MANLTIEIRSNDPTRAASVAKVDMKLEVVVIPVSDVDRAKEFYEKLGWRLDVRRRPSWSSSRRRAPGCSVQFGKNLTSAAPGSGKSYLIVSDIVAAREQLVAAGIEVGEFFHIGSEGRASGLDPERRTYGSRASFSDPGRQRLAAAGDH
jgi:catechol 2,3-dioxygenase-like lactoylglutathione lyase family enzyme